MLKGVETNKNFNYDTGDRWLTHLGILNSRFYFGQFSHYTCLLFLDLFGLFLKAIKKNIPSNAVNLKESSLCQPVCGCVEVLRLNVVERFV